MVSGQHASAGRTTTAVSLGHGSDCPVWHGAKSQSWSSEISRGAATRRKSVRFYDIILFKAMMGNLIHGNHITMCYISQGRIRVRLWGGGEFQLVELMYIMGENEI